MSGILDRLPDWVAVVWLPALAVVIIGAWQLLEPPPDRDVVGAYCNYGATSKAQYGGCVSHVTLEQVERRYKRDSKAAIYAIECGASGEYSGAEYMPECLIEPPSDPPDVYP